MVSGEDCSCNDATEASNITSLQSDTSCMGIKETVSDSVKREGFQPYNSRDCKCHEIHLAGQHGGSLEQYALTATIEETKTKDQGSKQQVQSQTPCLCHARKMTYTLPLKYRNGTSHSRPFWCPFKWKWPKKGYIDKKDKTYEVKLKPQKYPYYSEPFVCCEISEGIPKKKKSPVPEPLKSTKLEEKKADMTEKIDIYYFDHGNSAYYRTTDSPPILATEKCAEKTDQAATRFWAEIFGTVHIGTAFVTAFILQLVRFMLYSIIRPLTVGILQLFADYFIKPLLSILFNALIQPVLILLYNIATSIRDLCEPIAEAIGLFLREVARVCAAIRVVEINHGGAAPSVPCT